MDKLTIIKGFYGNYERPVYVLDYNNGGSMPTYERHGDQIDKEMVERILYAVDAGCEIEVIDKTN